MPVPAYQSIMRPILDLASDGEEHLMREAVETLATQFQLTPAEREVPLPSRTQPVFDNRVGWAKTYLAKARLLESPRRGYFRITQRGKDVLKSPPDRLDAAFLKANFQEFRDFIHPPDDGSAGTVVSEAPSGVQGVTPEEALESAYGDLKNSVESDILDRLLAGSPGFFERVVVRLLVAMGYGGSLSDAGAAIGKSGDEGIDGIIKEDRLGLDVVYIQAKRWNTTVGSPEIQKFAGALQGQKASKGVFITTSTFSSDAKQFAAKIQSKIVLIDGQHLASLMFEHNVGVTRVTQYEVKKIDLDFFDEA